MSLRTASQIFKNFNNGNTEVFAGLGDSIMWGAWAYPTKENIPSTYPASTEDSSWVSYMNLLRNWMKTKNVNNELYNHGIGGWTTWRHLYDVTPSTIDTIISHGNVSLVFVALGVNESSGTSFLAHPVTADEYYTYLGIIVDQFRNAGIQVVLVKENAFTKPWSQITSSDAQPYNFKTQYLSKLVQVASEKNVDILDCWTPFNNLFEAGSYNYYFKHWYENAIDQLHPNNDGHQFYFNIYKEYIESYGTGNTPAESTAQYIKIGDVLRNIERVYIKSNNVLKKIDKIYTKN